MYEVVVESRGRVWHGMDHTTAENTYARYVGRTLKEGDYKNKGVTLLHNGNPIKTHKPSDESFSEGTVC